MPDPDLLLHGCVAALIVAAAVVLVCSWPWGQPRPVWGSVGPLFGSVLGFCVGCCWLGVRPRWPPQEDADRLLLLLLPAIVTVETVGALLGRLKWVIWLLRMAIAAGAGWLLLHESVYLADLSGPDTREW